MFELRNSIFSGIARMLPGNNSTAPSSSNLNDVSLGGLGMVRLTGASAIFNLTGIAAPSNADGSFCVVVNATAYTMTILAQSSSSSAANRIAGSGGTVVAGGAAFFIYDATDSRWRLVAIGAGISDGVQGNLDSKQDANSNLDDVSSSDGVDFVKKVTVNLYDASAPISRITSIFTTARDFVLTGWGLRIRGAGTYDQFDIRLNIDSGSGDLWAAQSITAASIPVGNFAWWTPVPPSGDYPVVPSGSVIKVEILNQGTTSGNTGTVYVRGFYD